MTGTLPDLPPPPAGSPEQVQTAAYGFRTVATEITTMSTYLRDSAQRLADQALSAHSEVSRAFLTGNTEIRAIMTGAAQVADRFRSTCDTWAREMTQARADYDAAGRDYDEAVAEYRSAQGEVARVDEVDALPAHRRFVETGAVDAGLSAQLRLAGAQRLVDEAVARAHRARERADEAARQAARDFSDISTLRWNGHDLSRVSFVVEGLGQLTERSYQGHRVPLNRGVSRAFTALGFVVTYVEEGATNSNPDLHPEEQVAWTVSDSVVRTGTSWGAGSAVGGGTVAAWAAIGGAAGPPGIVAGILAGAAAAIVTDNVVSDRLDANHARDGGYLDTEGLEEPVESRYPHSVWDFGDEPPQDPPSGPIPAARPLPQTTIDDD